MSLVEFLGIAAAVCLVVALWARPVGFFAMFVALVVVGTAIIVSWSDVERLRADRAARAAFQQQTASAAIAVPPPDHPHTGS
ncbi:MAG TPA: hypothetical protein VMI30_08580 [Stellaceae bacterium]|nr:hypothetical protein [Stellaceae bacterium]